MDNGTEPKQTNEEKVAQYAGQLVGLGMPMETLTAVELRALVQTLTEAGVITTEAWTTALIATYEDIIAQVQAQQARRILGL